jgi:hypothetical protein
MCQKPGCNLFLLSITLILLGLYAAKPTDVLIAKHTFLLRVAGLRGGFVERFSDLPR